MKAKLKTILRLTLELMKSFWSSSVTILWAFIPILVLGSYKIEMMEISLILTQLRIHLYRYWGYYWIAFFISNVWSGIKK